MQPDEVLVFRGYGNEPVWKAGVPHSAFDDSSCPPNGPARVSIDARVRRLQLSSASRKPHYRVIERDLLLALRG